MVGRATPPYVPCRDQPCNCSKATCATASACARLNGQIVHSSIVEQFNGRLVNAAAHAIPPNYMDKLDRVCEAYQQCTQSSACSRVRSAVADAGAHLAQSHFGYGTGSHHRRLQEDARNTTDYLL